MSNLTKLTKEEKTLLVARNSQLEKERAKIENEKKQIDEAGISLKQIKNQTIKLKDTITKKEKLIKVLEAQVQQANLDSTVFKEISERKYESEKLQVFIKGIKSTEYDAGKAKALIATSGLKAQVNEMLIHKGLVTTVGNCWTCTPGCAMFCVSGVLGLGELAAIVKYLK